MSKYFAFQNNNFSVHTLPGNNKSDPSVLEITLKKYFPLQREMYDKFNITYFLR